MHDDNATANRRDRLITAMSKHVARPMMSKWEALGFMMILAFLNYMDRNLLLPLQETIQTDLELSDTQLGALSTGFHVVYAFSAPLIGYISDRVERRSILLLSLVAWSLVTSATGLSVGFVSLLIARSLTGLGEGGYFPTAVSLIGDFFGAHQRGRAIAMHGTCTVLGGASGLFLGGWLGERFGWRAPFLMAVVPGLALATMMAIRFREPPRGAQAGADVPNVDSGGDADHASAQPRRYVRIVFSPSVLLIALAAGAAAFAMAGFTQYLPKYMTEVAKLSPGQTGIWTAIGFAVPIISVLPGGFASDLLAARMRGARPLLTAVPYAAVAPAFFFLPLAQTSAGITLLYGLAMFGRGFAEPNIYGSIIEAVPARERGAAQGFLLMLTFGGASAAGLVGGAILDQVAGPKASRTIAMAHDGYRTLFGVLGTASIVAAAIAATVFVVRRRS